MPVLRRSTHSSLQSTPALSIPNLQAKTKFTTEDFKKEYDKIISNISTRDIKQCLRSSASEAKFYSDICREELKKLEEEKQGLDKKISVETEVNKKKDAEAARIVKKLWEEVNKSSSGPKNRKSGGKNGLRPEDVKKVWAEARKLSNQSKVKKRKMVAQRNSLDTKIHLAREAIKFCQKFSDGSRK